MKSKLEKRERNIWAGLALSFSLALMLTFAETARAQLPPTPLTPWAPDGNNNIYNTNSGNVGIGTGNNTPGYRLDVLANAPWVARFKKTDATSGGIIIDAAAGYNPNVAMSVNGIIKWYMNSNSSNSDALQFWDSTGSNARFTLTQAGNVGIGTTSPGVALEVGQNKAIRLGNANISSGGDYVHISNHTWFNGSAWQFDGSPGALYQISGQNHNWYKHDGGGFTTLMSINANGNVGINTSSPSARMSVVGANGPSDNTMSPAPDALQVIGGVGGNGTWGASPGGVGGAINLTGGTGGTPVAGYITATGGKGGSINLTGGAAGPDPFNVGGSAGGDIILNGGPGAAINGSVILANIRGNVGIGTTSPGQKLSVAGIVESTSNGFKFPDGSIQTTAAFAHNTLSASDVSAAQFGANTGGGDYSFPANVGIGTTSPGNRLDIQGGNTNSSSGFISRNNPWSTADSAFFPNGITTAGTANWIYGGTTYIGNAPANGYGHQFNAVSGASNAYLAIGGGNVGIGTTNPAVKLDVLGDMNASGTITGGNIRAKYQDVAEWVPASGEIPTGTVVVLDSTKSNQVIASSQAYDTRVAGVISERPGIALGENGEGKVLVATTGRVRVKVDASRAPIHVGDLLVTSDIPGVAMKSEPVNVGGVQLHRPGTLIGKALEPLATGKGEILVLLSLQ